MLFLNVIFVFLEFALEFRDMDVDEVYKHVNSQLKHVRFYGTESYPPVKQK